jgi:hypothetical protein
MADMLWCDDGKEEVQRQDFQGKLRRFQLDHVPLHRATMCQNTLVN